MATKIYTKTGDNGDTGLFGGTRVPKDHICVEAYGTVDELNAVIGIARLHCVDLLPKVSKILESIQSLLFELGSELATAPSAKTIVSVINQEDISNLEKHIDDFENTLPQLKSFILPGGSHAASYLHMARTVCRRAERRVVSLSQQDDSISPLSVVFLNRLSDLLFVLGRIANFETGFVDIPWKPRLK
jgi:cob(I)alamin adenosyltransferase